MDDPLANAQTEGELAVQIARWLKRLAVDASEVEIVRVGNGDEPEAVIPGEVETYAERLADIKERAQRIRDAYPEAVVARVDELLANQ